MSKRRDNTEFRKIIPPKAIHVNARDGDAWICHTFGLGIEQLTARRYSLSYLLTGWERDTITRDNQ